MMDSLAEIIHDTARAKGFYLNEGEGSFFAERIALIHSEASEALESWRKDDINSIEEELADIIIRVLDLSHHMGFSMDEAVAKKMKKNKDRPYLHGKVR